MSRKPADLGDWHAHYKKLWKPEMTSTPVPMEGMTLAEWQAGRAAAQALLARFERARPVCSHCQHFFMGGCKVAGGQEIPLEFQNTPEACTSWQWDSIPL